MNKKFVWFCIAAHLAIVLPLAWKLNLWLDETWSFKTTDDIRNVWAETIHGERQAPLYFFLLAVWRFLLGESVFIARLFSAFCIAGAIFVFNLLAKRIFPETGARYATAFFALHPFLIWAALEARVYALAVLFSALLLFFWQRAYAAEENKGARTIYTFLSIIGLYAYYYLGFLLVANAVALAVSGRWKQLKSYLLQMLIVGVGIAPLLFLIKLQFSVNSAHVRADASLLEGARLVWQHFLNFVLPAEIAWLAIIRLWLVRVSIAALIFVLIKNKARNLSWQTLALGALTAVCSLFFVFVYYLLGALYLEIRHVAPLFVPASLFLASLLFDVVPRRRLVWVAALLVVFYAASLFAIYMPLAKRGDWARIAAFIQANEHPDEPIIVFRAYDELPLGFYYRGVNRIVLKDEPHERFGAEDKPKTATRWRRQIESMIAEIPPETRRLWLVTEETCDNAETAVECQPLEDFVREHYVVERTEFFYKRKLRILRRK